MDEQIEQIAPCPFCGSKSVVTTHTHLHWVVCDDCQAEGPTRTSKAEAIPAWNTRAAAGTIAELTEALANERSAILELIDGSIERWRPSGGDPNYIEGYEVGTADACTFLAEDIRKGPPYPSAALAPR